MAQPASLNIPESTHTYQLSIINTTCDFTLPPDWLVQPRIAGYDWLNLPTYSFHLKNSRSGSEILFDLGCRKDWYNLVPNLAQLLDDRMRGFRVSKGFG